ncbi:Sorting nexin, cytoplasm-to-vacuole targeting pathway/endosomal sorting [Geranomyces variabilis]|nr:Sorting nexin, cytoplasm-to-vacuole targeting pathway/endosomal sorting [Geranomyces variabilis]
MILGSSLLRANSKSREATANNPLAQGSSPERHAYSNPDAFPSDRPSRRPETPPAAPRFVEHSGSSSLDASAASFSNSRPMSSHQSDIEDGAPSFVSSAMDNSSPPAVSSIDNIFGRKDEQRKKTGPCCQLERRILATPATDFMPLRTGVEGEQVEPVITIAQALKSNDMAGGSYIAYIIHTRFPSDSTELESKHRYSEFEGFRNLLLKLHPTAVIPPIPQKHSVADYAAKPKKAKEDPHIIEQRKRMLQSFLNRVAAHPVLREEHVFHRFLEGGAMWADILADSGLSSYLKKKDTSVKVSEKGALRRPDPHFVSAEDYTARFASQINHTYKVHKIMAKHMEDMAATYSDLGAAYNGWSLSENVLAHGIEQVGQAVDSTVSATQQLCRTLDGDFATPLQEYIQYSKSVETLLKWRHKKHVEYETLSDSLIRKQSNLQKLEASESEAQRLSAVLNAEGAAGSGHHHPHHSRNSSTASSSAASGGGIMATINSFIDNDPAATRRNNISRTRDRIATIEAQRTVCRQELELANDEIQKDLDRFQMHKIADLRNMMLAYAVAQRAFCKKAMDAWTDAKAEVEKITH